MTEPNRRQFLTGLGITVGSGAAALSTDIKLLARSAPAPSATETPESAPAHSEPPPSSPGARDDGGA